MISIQCSALIVLLALASTALGQNLDCPGQRCPEQNFTFTCSGEGNLTWFIANANNVQVANYSIFDMGLTAGQNDEFGDMNQFMVQRVTDDSTMLWFRANPNYNGYTVTCVDDDAEENNMDPSCSNLQVISPPQIPFNIDLSSATTTSVRLSWSRPINYDCIITYFNLYLNGMNIANFNGSVFGYDLPITRGMQYCPMISARDTAMQSSTNATRCIYAQVPPAVMLNENMYDYSPGEFVNITVSWTLPDSNTPDITGYTVRYNETYMNDMGSGSGNDGDDNVRERAVPAGQTSVKLVGSFRENTTYFVEVIPSNVFGAGNSTRMVFTIPFGPTPSTMPPGPDGGLSTGAIIGIIIGAIVGLILLVVIVVVVIVVIVCVVSRTSKGDKPPHELTRL